MDNVWGIITIMLGLIFVGLVLTHGDAAVSLINATGKFATQETTALQYR